MTVPTNCQNFESRLNHQLDVRLPLGGDRELIAHTLDCAKCRVLFRDYQAIDDCLNPTTTQSALRRSRAIPLGVQKPIAFIYSLAVALTICACLAFGLSRNSKSSTPTIANNAYSSAHFNDAIDHRWLDGSAVKKKMAKPRITDSNRSLVTWNQISEQLLPLNSYYQISAELPGVRPFQCSLGLTIDWFQQTFLRLSQSGGDNPGFGIVIRDPQYRCI